MTYDRGTIVIAEDPFKGEDASRPWLLIGTDETPFYRRYRRMPRGLTPGLNPIGRDTNH